MQPPCSFSSDLGIATAITYFVASGRASPETLWPSVSRFYVATIAVAVAVAGIVVVSPLRVLMPATLSDFAVLAGLGLFLGFSQAANWLFSVLVADRRFAWVNTISAGVTALGAVAAVSLLLLRPPWADVPAIIAVLVGVEATRAGLAAALLGRRHLRRSAQTPTARSRRPRFHATMLIRYSMLVYAAGILQFLVYRFDMWVVDA